MAPREPIQADEEELEAPLGHCCCCKDANCDTISDEVTSSATCRQRVGFGPLIKQDLNAIRCKLTLTINEDWQTVSYNQLPLWLRGTPYLLNGHRPQLRSLRVAFKSIFRWHSETLNIWTHGLGFLFFVQLCPQFFNDYQELDFNYKLMALIWFFGQIACCGLSAVYHTFNCHSHHVGTLLVKCDYLGIFASCWATLISAGYFCLYCHPNALICWLVLSAAIFAVGPRMVMTENNLHRVCIYALVVLPNLIAFLVAISELMVYHPQLVGSAIYYLIGTYGFPLSGAFVYLQKVPEKLAPGRFDLVGHSHQLMHLLVLGCMYSQYKLLIIATQLRINGRCDNY